MLFVTDDDGIVMEHVEIYDDGKVLAYDEHVVDEYDQLADQPRRARGAALARNRASGRASHTMAQEMPRDDV